MQTARPEAQYMRRWARHVDPRSGRTAGEALEFERSLLCHLRQRTRRHVLSGRAVSVIMATLDPVGLDRFAALASCKGGNRSSLSLPSSKSTFSQPFNRKCISEVERIGSIIIFHLNKLWKAKFSTLCVMLYFLRGCRGNLELTTLGTERVN